MAALPLTGISVSLVRDTIGAGSNDVGTLCTHPNINKWSRWKPVRHPKVGGLTEGDLITAKGGLSYPSFSTVAELVAFYRSISGNYQWSYERPRGGDYNEYYRIADFRGYDHTTGRFYSLYPPLPNIFISSGYAECQLDPWGLDDSVMLNWHIMDIEHLYFGAVIVRQFQTTGYIEQAYPDPLLNPDRITQIVQIPLTSAISGQTYEMYAFICEKTGGEITNYYAMDGGKTGTFVMRENEVEVLIDASIIASGMKYNVVWNLYMENYTISPKTFTNCHIRLRYSDNDVNDPLESEEREISLGNIILPGYGIYEDYNNPVDQILQDYNLRGAVMYFINDSFPELNTFYPIFE